MEERIERLYKEGKLDVKALIKAVDKGFLSENKFFILADMTIKQARLQYAE